ncbi:hypothetical protein LTR56_028262, partial [Elasticomyces elasticus]
MGWIYSSSIGNLVYLGELEDTDMAARIQCTIDKLLTHARTETNDMRTFDSAVLGDAQIAQRRRQGLPFNIDVDAVRVVLKLPWFR